MKLQAVTFTATVTIKNGRRVEITELLTARQHETNARQLGASKLALSNGTQIYINN